MTEQENPLFPEEIQAEKENLSEQLIHLDGGRTLELFYDTDSKEPRRFYIRDQDGKLVEFNDLEKPNDVYNYMDVKNQIAEKTRIIVTENEAKEITKILYARNVKKEMDQREVLE